MRENPSKGYVEWALRRFGPEWVEANLLVGSRKQDSSFRFEVSSPLPVMQRNRKTNVTPWVQVVLADFKMSALPSAN